MRNPVASQYVCDRIGSHIWFRCGSHDHLHVYVNSCTCTPKREAPDVNRELFVGSDVETRRLTLHSLSSNLAYLKQCEWKSPPFHHTKVAKHHV